MLARASVRDCPSGIRRGRGLAPGGGGLWSVEDGLDVVAVGIEDEGRKVLPAVLRPQTRLAVVRTTVTYCGIVPAPHSLSFGRAERDVRRSCHVVSTRIVADGVQAEIVTATPTEQDVGVALELALARQRNRVPPKRPRTFVGGRQVAHPDANVVDDIAHRCFRPRC
jgi:hypothetical protein